ncbi:uncharacterized protein MKK02DRAFT_43164 [Dioszegia hungarica]|uniref:Elongator complex protein 5 n=1 Tax=Dioszegia hungarica TaxID=4972 RepID=A0AA38LWX0_9TREE|nr:uncharacterized protein MKK02DRAFT_43164 [Dioszegia hungarica]KAI9637244.1 hypothetical protein MKK02DRAFT_43164 [Dioszegia hungarica]
MSFLQLLDAALNNASIPHQPYVLISDEPTFGGLPIMREIIRRSIARNASVLLICVLRPPSTYLPGVSGQSGFLEVVDLSDRVPGYGSSDLEGIKAEILEAARRMGPKVEIYIDAVDVLAEDHTSAGALSLIRSLLKQIKANKAPSRLTLLLSPHSALYPSLLPPSFCAPLTQLQPHPLSLLSALSTAYLAPISPDPRFTDLLTMASERRIGERMAWLGESSLGDWSAGSGQGAGSGSGGGGVGKGKGKRMDSGDGQGVAVAAVQVVVRKATGGAKGMSRSLEGLASTSGVSVSGSSLTSESCSTSTSTLSGTCRLAVRPLESLIDLQPFSHPAATQAQQPTADTRASQDKPAPAPQAAATHTALNLPFNLSLTDEQRRRRDRVPIPYVHEGEGVEVGWEEEEEDDDDEEI